MTNVVNSPQYYEAKAARRFLGELNDQYFWHELDCVINAIADIMRMHELACSNPVWVSRIPVLEFEDAEDKYAYIRTRIEKGEIKISLDMEEADLEDKDLVKILPHLKELKQATLNVLDTVIALMPQILFSSLEDQERLYKVANARGDNALKTAIREKKEIGVDSKDPIADHYDTIQLSVVTLPDQRRLLLSLDAPADQVAEPMREKTAQVLDFRARWAARLNKSLKL